MTFDINAPLERQRTRDLSKILWLSATGLDEPYSLIVLVEGINEALNFSITGEYCPGVINHPLDLLTLPERKPLIVTYHNMCPGVVVWGYENRKMAEGLQSPEVLATVETIFDPNTGKSSAKTIWNRDNQNDENN